ncbi:WXG100 family type VII secretion target [Amycolatopsis sp. NBC_01488]|uniref:WXG100 family type VII secretion target n=1 Tax=Amycolatopsis sp. NBC_01488 TaxID=2903563 RepID=UPI002E2C32B4|nr:WXG100 family type VII secretion target [Amycolatopsis sp. NBC_01488]
MTRHEVYFGFADLVLDRMGEITGELGDLLAELESTVEPGLAGWSGEAREEYLRAKRDWGRAAERMPGCLERAREAFGELGRGVR